LSRISYLDSGTFQTRQFIGCWYRIEMFDLFRACVFFCNVITYSRRAINPEST